MLERSLRGGAAARAAVGPVLVIGAGMAGLTCARTLGAAGEDVLVIDEARGPGGRASTRSTAEGAYDHGAQYFTARDAGFLAAVGGWAEAGVIAPWTGWVGELRRGGMDVPAEAPTRWVGVPRMSALSRHLAEGLALRSTLRAVRVTPGRDGWRVACEDGADLGPFAVVVMATPSPQAVTLLDAAPDLAARVSEARVDPCWAVMLSFQRPLALALDGAFVRESPLAWIAREASKPGRAPGERWVLHAGPDWSAAHLETPAEEVMATLLRAFATATGLELPEPTQRAAHRWLYAQTRRALETPCLFDAERRIGVCGDYCLGGRLECAWQSGRALGLRLLEAALIRATPDA